MILYASAFSLPGFCHVNFISALLGLLGMKIGALLAPFFLRRMYPDDFVTKEEAMGPFEEEDEEEEGEEPVVENGELVAKD